MVNLITLSSKILLLILVFPPFVFIFLRYEHRRTSQRQSNDAAKTQFRNNLPYVGVAVLLWILMLSTGSDYLKDIVINEPITITGTVRNVNVEKKSRRRSIVVVEVLTSDGELLELKVAPSCYDDYILRTDTLYLLSYYPQTLALCEADIID